MIEILAILLGGIIIGRILRGYKTVTAFASKMTVTVWILILALGVSVGSNPYLIAHLPTLGAESIALGAFATAGSIIAVSLIRRYIKRP